MLIESTTNTAREIEGHLSELRGRVARDRDQKCVRPVSSVAARRPVSSSTVAAASTAFAPPHTLVSSACGQGSTEPTADAAYGGYFQLAGNLAPEARAAFVIAPSAAGLIAGRAAAGFGASIAMPNGFIGVVEPAGDGMGSSNALPGPTRPGLSCCARPPIR